MKASETSSRRLTSASGARLIVATIFASGIAIVLAIPRSIPPQELPALRLDPAEVSAALEADRVVLGGPIDDQAAGRIRAFVAMSSEREVEPVEGLRPVQRPEIGRLDQATLAALRAEAAEELEQALAGDLDADLARRRLGAFPRAIRAYGLTLSSRRFVLRCLYKARWNAMLGLEPTGGFRPIEEQAYWGWLALHAERVELPARLYSVRRYEQAGGRDGAEARALLLQRGGRQEEAGALFAQHFLETSNLRIRNHALSFRPPAEVHEP